MGIQSDLNTLRLAYDQYFTSPAENRDTQAGHKLLTLLDKIPAERHLEALEPADLSQIHVEFAERIPRAVRSGWSQMYGGGSDASSVTPRPENSGGIRPWQAMNYQPTPHNNAALGEFANYFYPIEDEQIMILGKQFATELGLHPISMTTRDIELAIGQHALDKTPLFDRIYNNDAWTEFANKFYPIDSGEILKLGRQFADELHLDPEKMTVQDVEIAIGREALTNSSLFNRIYSA